VADGDGLVNKPLELFLLELSINRELRDRYSAASEAEKRQILAKEFEIGNATIDALLGEQPGTVAARFGFADQQGTPFGGTSSQAPRSKPPKKP
jgi:hypothetical protein